MWIEQKTLVKTFSVFFRKNNSKEEWNLKA